MREIVIDYRAFAKTKGKNANSALCYEHMEISKLFLLSILSVKNADFPAS
jgi:hypothetical protein